VIPVLVITGLALAAFASVAVISFWIGRSRDFGEIFHIRMEVAQARRRMHDLTRDAFVAMSEAAERPKNPHSGRTEN
jgi:hypothetical protein